MKSKDELVLEIVSMCLEYNCDTLHMFCDYSGHVSTIDVRVYFGGWSDDKAYNYENSVRLNLRDTPGYLLLVINELKDIKAEHDLKYSPEYIESTKEQERLYKIEKLQREIDLLSE